jgi:glycosyltransferase involved in cell wall biosynthesis
MPHSLSVVLPVHNAQTTLTDTVFRLLDILPDVADRFEVLIVDDASRDYTAEVAGDLVQEFPQVGFVRHGMRRGMAAAIETGMQRTTGDFVLVQDQRDPLRPQVIRRLWEMRLDEQLVVARIEPTPPAAEASLLSRLIHWGRAVQTAHADRPLASGTQLISRQAVIAMASEQGGRRGLEFARVDGAERIAWTGPRQRAGGVMGPLKEFALGE